MFNVGDANEDQRQAITATEGPVLITAGPGTGKTHTLVQRTMYLIEERRVKPENILLATFTEKAARELITRLTNELASRGQTANLNEMYIGTIHSICRRILKENLAYTRLRRNYLAMEDFDQPYMVFLEFDRFRSLPGASKLFDTLNDSKPQNEEQEKWKYANRICTYVNFLSEELIDPDELISDASPKIQTVGLIYQEYQALLMENNLLDYSSILLDTYRLLQNNPQILAKLQNKITYIMVDEYQDTNYIQEQLVFLLAGERQNICVVGDDDQGLYRFRGATIRNILEFSQKFADKKCQTVQLVKNYRSNRDIIDFYNKWMVSPWEFTWENFRHAKTIIPQNKPTLSSPTVVKLPSKNNYQDWHEQVCNFVKKLKETGKIADYNQVAFLFSSVKVPQVVALADYLEKHKVPVYSPRSAMFFQREEIRLAIGCLVLLFPRYSKWVKANMGKEEHAAYYQGCVQLVFDYFKKPGGPALGRFLKGYGQKHENLTSPADYTYSGLLYRLFEFEPFAQYLDIEMTQDVLAIRPARNLAILTQLIGKYERMHNIDRINALEADGSPSLDSDTNRLFNTYLRFRLNAGMTEYEDDSEYAPSGCVPFYTIHQAKGMEFPIVIVGSLQNCPYDKPVDLMDFIAQNYCKRPEFEPFQKIKYYDFWRKYYTAFSRAQDLLVLTSKENKSSYSPEPKPCFNNVYRDLIPTSSPKFDLNEIQISPIKKTNLKNTYSFTSHIALYDTCALRYKFYKELGFAPALAKAVSFGTLVHQTIEDIHKAVLKQEELSEDTIADWFYSNYATLSKSDHVNFDQKLLEQALRQVLRYVERQNGDWSHIRQAEFDVSLVKPDYIVEGKIDLIRGAGDTIEIVDFKSGRKPAMDKAADSWWINRYRKQLQIYARLVEAGTDHKVSKMHLYYTGEDESDPYITFPYDQTEVDDTMDAFERTVKKIMNKDFSHPASDKTRCQTCDFRFYCGRK